MSLTFGAAGTHIVNCGSRASLDDLPQFTLCVWVYPTTFSLNRCLFGKSVNNVFRLADTSGNIKLDRTCATTSLSYIANSRPLVLNKWCFASAVMRSDLTASIYTGSLTDPAYECGYSTATPGVGALTSDASADFSIANRAGNSLAFQGSVATFGIWRYAMPIWDIRDQQHNPRPGPGCVGFWRLGGRYGTGRQFDESGFANHGTVTGATANTIEPPLYIQPKRRIWYVPEVVVGATAVPVFYRHLQTQGIA